MAQMVMEERPMEEMEAGFGWIVFSSVILLLAGLNSLLWGIAAVRKNSLFVNRFLYGSVTSWGIVWIVLGGLTLIAAAAILAKVQVARWFGVTMIGFIMLSSLFYMWVFPVWSLIVIILGAMVIYGLVVYGSREAVWR